MSAKHIVKLDKPRELKFTMTAIVTLDELFGINVYESKFYNSIDKPGTLVSMIWAAQLHTPKPLRREQVAKYLPTDMAEFMTVGAVVVSALGESIHGIKDKKTAGRSKA